MMSIIFDSQGYFCEGAIDSMWQDKMKFGRIILTNEAFIFEGGTQLGYITKFNEGFNVAIPLSQIKKAYKKKHDCFTFL